MASTESQVLGPPNGIPCEEERGLAKGRAGRAYALVIAGLLDWRLRRFTKTRIGWGRHVVTLAPSANGGPLCATRRVEPIARQGSRSPFRPPCVNGASWNCGGVGLVDQERAIFGQEQPLADEQVRRSGDFRDIESA